MVVNVDAEENVVSPLEQKHISLLIFTYELSWEKYTDPFSEGLFNSQC